MNNVTALQRWQLMATSL